MQPVFPCDAVVLHHEHDHERGRERDPAVAVHEHLTPRIGQGLVDERLGPLDKSEIRMMMNEGGGGGTNSRGE